MSLINDALKRAKQAPASNPPSTVSPLQPTAHASTVVWTWLIPTAVIGLSVAAIVIIGWAVTRHPAQTSPTVSAAPATNQLEDKVVVSPVPAPPPVTVTVPPPPAPVNLPKTPKLQGVFYSPTKPTAIVDGKAVEPGDQFGLYRVKEITKSTVTLIGVDKKEITLSMGN